MDNNRSVALGKLLGDRTQSFPRDVISVFFARPLAVEAELRRGGVANSVVLIEDTAARVGFPIDDIVLGGAHLGPNYWPAPRASVTVTDLFDRFEAVIPETPIRQYLGRTYPEVVSKDVLPRAREHCLAMIDAALTPYSAATAPQEMRI